MKKEILNLKLTRKQHRIEKRSVEKKKKNSMKSLKLKLLCFVSVEEPSSVTNETSW